MCSGRLLFSFVHKMLLVKIKLLNDMKLVSKYQTKNKSKQKTAQQKTAQQKCNHGSTDDVIVALIQQVVEH